MNDKIKPLDCQSLKTLTIYTISTFNRISHDLLDLDEWMDVVDREAISQLSSSYWKRESNSSTKSFI